MTAHQLLNAQSNCRKANYKLRKMLCASACNCHVTEFEVHYQIMQLNAKVDPFSVTSSLGGGTSHMDAGACLEMIGCCKEPSIRPSGKAGPSGYDLVDFSAQKQGILRVTPFLFSETHVRSITITSYT